MREYLEILGGQSNLGEMDNTPGVGSRATREVDTTGGFDSSPWESAQDRLESPGEVCAMSIHDRSQVDAGVFHRYPKPNSHR